MVSSTPTILGNELSRIWLIPFTASPNNVPSFEGLAKVDDNFWAETDGHILQGIDSGSLRDGLVAGIDHAGDCLAEFFPWVEGDRNEIPDRLIVRRE